MIQKRRSPRDPVGSDRQMSLMPYWPSSSDETGRTRPVLDRTGIRTVLTPPVTDEEAAALRRSADAVRNVARSLGL